MVLKKEILFHSSKSKVWDLLTNPALTKQYMFGCEVLSDWAVGSQILWKGKTENGKDIILVKGEITLIDLGNCVGFTMFDPNMGLKDVPENYIHLTYDLKETESGTLLTLTQGDFSKVKNGQKRHEDTKKGWEMVIPLMRKMLEPS